jgi:hypothetical protein
MKGIIFNLAAEVVATAHGEDAWDDILDAAGLDGAFTSLGNYADEDLFRLVEAAANALGAPVHDVVREVGEGALPILARTYPDFFTPFTSARPFLLTLNEVIHAEVRKLYPGAEVPEFEFDDSDPSALVMRYRSRRRLCALAEGFIVGAARHFGEDVPLAQTSCMLDGADHCEFRCSFEPAGVQHEHQAAG